MKGVIFDWDGVVIDSAPQHERSWEILAAEAKKSLPEGHFQKGFGKKNHEIISKILQWSSDSDEVANLGVRKEEIYRELVREQGVRILPGARDLLQSLREENIPRALGSSTPWSNLEALFATTSLGEMFDAVVCGDDVTHGKPAPDVFLLAAQRLRISPGECVVIEDAHVGIEAAHRAGMKVLAVATTHSLSELGGADAQVASLEEVDAAFLRGLLA